MKRLNNRILTALVVSKVSTTLLTKNYNEYKQNSAEVVLKNEAASVLVKTSKKTGAPQCMSGNLPTRNCVVAASAAHLLKGQCVLLDEDDVGMTLD